MTSTTDARSIGADAEQLTAAVAVLVARTVAHRSEVQKFIHGQATAADCNGVTAEWLDAAQRYARLVSPPGPTGIDSAGSFRVARALTDALLGDLDHAA